MRKSVCTVDILTKFCQLRENPYFCASKFCKKGFKQSIRTISHNRRKILESIKLQQIE